MDVVVEVEEEEEENKRVGGGGEEKSCKGEDALGQCRNEKRRRWIESVNKLMKKTRVAFQKCKNVRRETLESLDRVVRKSQEKLASGTCRGPDDVKGILREFKRNVDKTDAYKKVNKLHKQLYASILKLRKGAAEGAEVSCEEDVGSVEKEDDNALHRDSHLDPNEEIMERIIANEMYRTQEFEAVEALADGRYCYDKKDKRGDKFRALAEVLEAVRNRDLPFLLRWVSMNKDAVRNGKAFSEIEFLLLSIEFDRIARETSPTDAIRFARTDMHEFCERCPEKMKALMTSLLFIGDGGDEATAVKTTDWSVVERDVRREACRIVGLPIKSRLATTIEAGIAALPTLLKYKKLSALRKEMGRRQAEEEEEEGRDKSSAKLGELPIAFTLPKRFKFHSVFVCPVSRAQTTETNPPVLLKCGHAISQDAMTRLCETQYWPSRHSRSLEQSRRFKCPYCSTEQSKDEARQLHI